MHMIGKESTLEHSIISQITILMLHVIKMYAKQYALECTHKCISICMCLCIDFV